MSKADELLALAERCEKASEGTFQLDEAIALTTGLYVRERRGKDRQEWFYPADVRGFGRRSIYPLSDLGMHRYTTSLDAATTLVPEGFMRAMGSHNENNQPWACLTEPGGQCRDYAATGADEVLALCAAALRAQAEMEG